jgi:hypothetical protein
MGLNCGHFRVGSGRKIGLKTVLDHGGVGRDGKIEVQRLAGMHDEIWLLGGEEQGYHGRGWVRFSFPP